MGLSAAGEFRAGKPPPTDLGQGRDSYVAEIDVVFVLAAYAGACLTVDERQTKLFGQVFVDAAVASAGVDQGGD
jgi:hypothetical protein